MTATVQTHVGHDWHLVAPWWHWPLRDPADPTGPGRPADRRAVRTSAPVLQKYDSPDLVNMFLADPQRRLEFRPDTDEVFTLSSDGYGRIPTRRGTGRRKLYLGSHHRHYLVVCSLHCDVAGFPTARRADVCEAGFVVRRRTTDLPRQPDPQMQRALRRHSTLRRRREVIEQQIAALRVGEKTGGLRAAALEARLRLADRAELEARTVVQTWAHSAGAVRQLQGWIPTGVDGDGKLVPRPACTGSTEVTPLAGIGEWASVEEVPEQITEATYPLTPLVADPTRPGHDATGETIYFGVVPTGSSDVDARGAARFDEHAAYEIRCFVRRHRSQCPRDGAHCHCPVTWSQPTPAYQLAAHFDLEGTANRPVTVQMPDLRQLHADAIRLGPGGTGGVRFRSPVNSELAFTAKNLEATAAEKNTAIQICSFAIPLLTIVAFFVFRLFLPILVFVFQLWSLLLLRFCIPPDVKIDADLAGKFEALGGGLEIDGAVAATIASDAKVDEALTKLLGGTSYQPTATPGQTTLAGAVKQAHKNGKLDDRMYAVLARSALAQRPKAAVPGRVFAPRISRSKVVRP